MSDANDASDPDDIEGIKERKKEELAAKLDDDEDGPAHTGPVRVESIAAETSATVAKVDVDALQGLAREYGVQGVPTLPLFVDSEPPERLVGMQDEETLRSLVEQHV